MRSRRCLVLCSSIVVGSVLLVAPAMGISSTAKPIVWSFDYHGDALYAWAEALFSQNRSRAAVAIPATLVHIDSHADMAIPQVYFSSTEGKWSSQDLAQKVDINNFILAGLLLGAFDRVVWVRPAWATEGDYGHFEYFVAEDHSNPHDPVFVSNASFGSKVTEMHPSFRNVRKWSLDVLPISLASLHQLRERLVSEAFRERRDFLLDIDLDVFATENFGCNQLREDNDFKPEEIKEIHDCTCHAHCKEPREVAEFVFPGRFADDIEANTDIFKLSKTFCIDPLHYSSEEEVIQSKAAILSILKELHAEQVDPSMVTVCTSWDGYQPPQYARFTREIPAMISAILEADEPLNIPCLGCADLYAFNDLPDAVDAIYQDTDRDEGVECVLQESNVKPGEAVQINTFINHVFFFRTRLSKAARYAGARQKYKRLVIDKGVGTSIRLNMSAIPWALPGELVPGKTLKMRTLQDAEDEYDRLSMSETSEADQVDEGGSEDAGGNEEDGTDDYEQGDEDQHSCSDCVLLEAFNDLSEPVDAIFEDPTENDYSVMESDIQPGESFASHTYVDHAFLFRTRVGQHGAQIKLKRLIVHNDKGATSKLNLSTLPWINSEQLLQKLTREDYSNPGPESEL